MSERKVVRTYWVYKFWDQRLGFGGYATSVRDPLRRITWASKAELKAEVMIRGLVPGSPIRVTVYAKVKPRPEPIGWVVCGSLMPCQPEIFMSRLGSTSSTYCQRDHLFPSATGAAHALVRMSKANGWLSNQFYKFQIMPYDPGVHGKLPVTEKGNGA